MRLLPPVLAAALLAAASARAQAPAPSTPAERRALELVRLIDAGRPADILAYADSAFAGQFREIPASEHLGFAMGLHDRTRGVEVHGFQESSPTLAVPLLRAKLAGEWLALAVRVDSAAPHRVVGVGMRAPRRPASAAPAGRMSDREMAAELDAFMRRLAEADVFSGAVLLARGDEVLFQGAYGEANKDFAAPNRVDTKFNLGSMNKMFTAVAILQLAEQGRLSLTDPLSKYLPDFPSPEAAQRIRIEHLLTHTSGLGSYFNREFDESSRARFRTVDDMMALARGDSLAFEPGTRWSYSNTGFLVLGKVIEVVTGQSWYDYVREHVHRPAGMASTDAYELDRVNPNLAVGYQREYTAEGAFFRNNLFEHVIRGGPAGGGYSTVGDMHRFARALTGGRLLGDEWVRRLFTPRPDLQSPEYGYGMGVSDGGAIVGHSGGFTGISSNLDIFTQGGYVAVVMSNYGGAARPVILKIREMVSAGAQNAN